TNQIRAHLWHLGFPIMGDPAYLPNHKMGENRTLHPDDPPMCLHAWKLALLKTVHAGDEQTTIDFVASCPEWATDDCVAATD
ncbi:MAG: hypothetical protein AAFP90_01905, partial [Planctomycetota bacterium]